MPAWIQQLDERLLRWIAQTLRLPIADPVVTAYTALGNGGWAFILLGLILLVSRRTRKAGVSALSGMLLGLLVTNLTLKPLVSRLRPWVVMENFAVLVTSSDPNSFPSGHTCAAFACAAALSAVLPQKWARATAWIAAALMGFSRLYVGVHFPSDVLAGALVGTLCGLAGAWLTNCVVTWFRCRKAEE